MENKVTAIIPVRAGSKRLKNKNILPFGNSNLLVHKIRQLKQVENIDKIVVSSDSDEMLNMAIDEGVEIHKRAIEYCDEETKTFNEVVEHIAKSLNSENLMWAPCVCPLVKTNTYKNAIDTYFKVVVAEQKYDSVVSAKIIKEYIFDGEKPVNYQLGKTHVPTQNLPDWKIIVNGFFITTRENMINWKFVYGLKPYLYNISKQESIDIDDEYDYEVARLFYRKDLP